MRILRFDATALSRFGSMGVDLLSVGRFEGATVVHLAHVDEGGVIGRHPAVGTQVFAVLSGRALVSGDEGESAELSSGQAVVWQSGEQHETRALTALDAVILETKGVADLADS